MRSPSFRSPPPRLSDISGAMDKAQVTFLDLFYVSAAFDSVDHILLKRLSISFGLRDHPLILFTSYILVHMFFREDNMDVHLLN